ncbi:MAG: hypothetical protein WDN72_05785 [Alphaproteobacteria bacterium]
MRVIAKEPEAHLIELLNLVQDNRQGWQAVCFGFSRLLEHYRSEYQLKIAINLMNDLLGDRDGAIYPCADATIYIMVRHLPRPLMDKMVFQLRYLFMDDPLAYTIDGEENPEFATTYEIETQWQDFMDICKRRLVTRVKRTQAEQRGPSRADAQAMASAGISPTPYIRREVKQFNAGTLAAIEKDLKDVDLTVSLRRQPVVSITPERQIRTVFDEMYINIAQLRQSIGIEVDLLSNRWLFKYLTEVLDQRMLDTIQKNPMRYLTNPVSFNFNIATLLSTRFAEFDAAIKPATKVSIVIELQLADIFADMGGFLSARDTVQKLGYRVCLDGVSDISLPQIDRARLGFDLLKLIWNGNGAGDVGSEKNQRLAAAVRQCGANRVILTRCDDESAIGFGHALGITLFQGRYLDALVNPKSAVEN